MSDPVSASNARQSKFYEQHPRDAAEPNEEAEVSETAELEYLIARHRVGPDMPNVRSAEDVELARKVIEWQAARKPDYAEVVAAAFDVESARWDAEYEELTKKHGAYGQMKVRAAFRLGAAMLANRAQEMRAAAAVSETDDEKEQA